MVYILGVNESHNAGACLLKDGKVLSCVQEERFNRIKIYIGFPFKSIEYVLRQSNITIDQVDMIVLSFLEPAPNLLDLQMKSTPFLYNKLEKLYHKIYRYEKLKRLGRKVYKELFYKKYKDRQIKNISEALKIPPEKIISAHHHICHSYAPLFTTDIKDPVVITHDGAGDGLCGMISVANNGNLKAIATTPIENSLGHLYEHITQYLGMRPIHDEYKVMGLAPYAYKGDADKVYKVLKDLAWVDNLRFFTKVNSLHFYDWFKTNLNGYRFDWVAGAAQRLTEELLLKYVKEAVEKTGIHNVVAGGGVFMNVKANMAIQYAPFVDKFHPCPSSGDESTTIGAAFYGYKLWCEQNSKPFNPEPLTSLYLGPSSSDEEIIAAFKKHNLDEKYKIERIENIEEEIVELIVKGKIVARFKGRMEWGARALGNRSILANPSKLEIVEPLNKQIKSRDFWMPFAPTILAEREKDYIINPKNTKSPFMTIAFDSTDLAKKELRAAMHTYDKTLRPQILTKEANESYWKLIKKFEELTGIGGVLNTSFNLHGEPIVCNVDDAIHTLTSSGLEFLAIENFLISKK
jgi:carbamoyltransferase